MYKCSICNVQCKSGRSYLSHMKCRHKLTPQEVYDRFYKKENEGFCSICNRPTKFMNLKYGYRQYCCAKCAASSSSTKEKRVKTNLDKYGVINVSQSTDIKEIKAKKYEQQREYLIEKVKQTCLQKYGVESYTQSEEFKQKSKETHLKKYGVDNIVKTQQYIDKSNETRLKHIQYMSEQGYIPLKELIVKYNKYWYRAKIIDVIIFKNKGYVHEKDLINIINFNVQYKKTKNKNISKFHAEMYYYIVNYLNISNIKINIRQIIKPFELDLYISDYNFAIECDDIYWHSSNVGTDKFYHLNKTLMCNQKNISLIHITDAEWLFYTDAYKSLIASYMNIYTNTININKCKIKIINMNDEIKNFILANSLYKVLNFSKNSIINAVCLHNNNTNSLLQVAVIEDTGEKINIKYMATKLYYNVQSNFYNTTLTDMINFCIMNNVIDNKKDILLYIDAAKYNYKNYTYKNEYLYLGTTTPIPEFYQIDITNKSLTYSNTTNLNNKMLQLYNCGSYVLKYNKERNL